MVCPPIVPCTALLGTKDGTIRATAEGAENVSGRLITSSTYGPKVRAKDPGNPFVYIGDGVTWRRRESMAMEDSWRQTRAGWGDKKVPLDAL